MPFHHDPSASAPRPSTSEPPSAARAEPNGDVLKVPLVPVLDDARWSWKRIVFVVVAVVLLLGGFALVPLPVASGFVLWIPGALMLGIAVPPVARWLNRQEQKLPDRWRRRLRPRLWWRARRKLRDAVS
jgi:hypothetical protein